MMTVRKTVKKSVKNWYEKKDLEKLKWIQRKIMKICQDFWIPNQLQALLNLKNKNLEQSLRRRKNRISSFKKEKNLWLRRNLKIQLKFHLHNQILNRYLNLSQSIHLYLNVNWSLKNPSLKGLSKRFAKDLRLAKLENEEHKRKRILIINNRTLTQIQTQINQNLQP